MKLLKISDTLWAYQIEGRVYPGPRKRVLRDLISRGFSIGELEIGISDMLEKKNNTCEFGFLAKSFMFSKDDPEVPFLGRVAGNA